MYPSYNFLQQQPSFQQNPLMGQLPQMQPLLGQGMLQQQPQDDPAKHGHHGMNPLMMLSPLMAMFGSGHPNIGLGMISPGLGIARALGAFK